MVSSEEVDLVWVLKLQSEKKENGLKGSSSSVNVASKEEVIVPINVPVKEIIIGCLEMIKVTH